ncbi:hypothetical protein [Massilia violaceinigra]|nr:hypothetical protein [Massilia violaceinigra]
MTMPDKMMSHSMFCLLALTNSDRANSWQKMPNQAFISARHHHRQKYCKYLGIFYGIINLNMLSLSESKKDVVNSLLKVAIGIIVVPGAVLAFVWYSNWSAERSARVYCDGIQLGSDISVEIEKFEKNIGFEKEPGGKVSVRHYGFPQERFPMGQHTFLFNGFMFEKAYCDVSLSPDGKVTAKNSFIHYD